MNYPPESNEYIMLELVKQNSPEIYLNKKIFKNLISDYFPNKEIGKILKKIIEEDASQEIYNLKNSTSLSLDYTKACLKISQNSFISQEIATPAIELLCIGIGITPPNPKAEAEEKAKVEAKIRAEIEEKIKAEAQAKSIAEAEEKAKIEAEAKLRAEIEEKIKAEAEAKSVAEALEKAKIEAEEKALAQAQSLAEAQALAETEALNNTKKTKSFLTGVTVFVCLMGLFNLFGSSDEKATTSSTSQSSTSSSSPDDVHQIFYDFIDELAVLVDTQGVDFYELGLPSYLMYTVGENASKLHYAFLDLDNNGVDELLLTNSTDSPYPGYISALFSLEDDVIYSVINSEERAHVKLLNDFTLTYEGSNSADNSSFEQFKFYKNELVKIEEYVYQSIDADNPFGDGAWHRVPYNNGEFRTDRAYILAEQDEVMFNFLRTDEYDIPYQPISSIGSTSSSSSSSNTNNSTAQNSNINSLDLLVQHGKAYKGIGGLFNTYSMSDSYINAGSALNLIGSQTNDFEFYCGYGFEYYVVSNNVFVLFPGSEYAFNLGYILPSNFQKGDVLDLDGTEYIVDVVGITTDSELALASYSNFANLLTIQDGYDICDSFVSSHKFPAEMQVSLAGNSMPIELMLSDSYIPCVSTTFSFEMSGERHFLEMVCNRVDGSIYIQDNSGELFYMNEWYDYKLYNNY